MPESVRPEAREPLWLHSPAKINLLLHVHGPREDGFHELTSLVVPLAFGDQLAIRSVSGDNTLTCDCSELPDAADNLVLRAARSFREAVSPAHGFAFELRKRIPVGAGLGGGSSNAATALAGMNRLCGAPLDLAALRRLAAGIGSDCPMFIEPRPVLVRGRGDRVEVVDDALASRLRGLPVLVFHPGFGIGTPTAYRRLASRPGAFSPPSESAARLRDFAAGGGLGTLLDNDFTAPTGDKYLGIRCLLERLARAGAPCQMSGSGSACFAFAVADGPPLAELRPQVAAAWGAGAFCIETSVV